MTRSTPTRRSDLVDFDAVIEIDPERGICIAEPGVPFCKLVDKTLPLGLVPIVVPELKTITIGGAVAGCSIESMSFQYGGFHDTCLEYEIITAHGRRAPMHPRQRAPAHLPDDARIVRYRGHPVAAGVPADPGEALRAHHAREAHLDRQLPRVDPLALRAPGRGVHGWDHPLEHAAVAVRRGLHGLGALHQPLRLAEGLLPEHGDARRGLLRNAALLLSLRPRGHQRAPQVVSGQAPAGQVPGLVRRSCALPRRRGGWCSTTRVRT